MATFTNQTTSSTSYSNATLHTTTMNNVSKNGDLNYLLMEDGSYLLFEDSTKILLENIFGDNLVAYTNATEH
jgi:hypothetical protein